MGRLTLNVLLSFAQFEREVIGERVRDKISASKRKGLWVGGPVPLGYASIKKKLVIVPDEAQTVRMIFRRYLEVSSVRNLAGDLDRQGVTTKQRILSSGRVIGGGCFGVGGLNHLLRNRFYIGEIVYRGEIHIGDHEPILDRDLFEGVQAHLTERAIARRLTTRNSSTLLVGRLYDDLGNRMTPSHSVKKGVRYRYYVCSAGLQRKSAKVGEVARVSAPEIEALVLDTLKQHLEINTSGDTPGSRSDRDLVEQYIERVTISSASVKIMLVTTIRNTESKDDEADDEFGHDLNEGEPEILIVPWTLKSFTAVKGITHQPGTYSQIKPETQEALLTAISKARGWIEDIVSGRVSSLEEIALREGKVERHIRLLAPLAFVSPQTVKAIINGNASADITVTGFAKRVTDLWEDQDLSVE